MNLTEALAEIERLTNLNHSLAGRLVGMSDTLQASARQIAADAWDQGRASVALDFLKPLDEFGIRESTPNPYRQPIETLGGEA